MTGSPQTWKAEPDTPRRSAAYTLEDRNLVERMRGGEQRAFDEFIDAYAPRVGAFAARRSSLDTAALEDVVQITMINAVRGLDGFRGGSALFTWVCGICRNHLADRRRSLERQPGMQSLEQLDHRNPRTTPRELIDFRDPLDECARDSSRMAVRRALNQLAPHHVSILELRFGDDLTVPQIARILQLSDSAAESRLVRARRAFREIWSDASPAASA
jgi:RNA polymerase sigma factor (sigma-70 family)